LIRGWNIGRNRLSDEARNVIAGIRELVAAQTLPLRQLPWSAKWLAPQTHGIRNQTILYCRSQLPYLSSQSLILFQKTALHLITGSLIPTTCPMFRHQAPNSW
jgi:hypothetical protein